MTVVHLQQPAAMIHPAPPRPASELDPSLDRNRLLEQHLPEVRYIARRIHSRLPSHVQLDDLVHAGVLGLIDAIDKFDPLKQVQLKSYAKFRIRGAILDSLRASDWSPRSLRRQARQLQEAQRDLCAALGRPPTDTELAARLDMNLAAFQQLLGDIRGLDLGNLQSPADQSDWAGRPDLEDKQSVHQPNAADADPFSLCLRAEMKSHLVRAMHSLEIRERQVIALYYGDELTMKEVGVSLGVGESRVSQIHSAAMTRLRGRLQTSLRSAAAA